jgi:hypothetical protein
MLELRMRILIDKVLGELLEWISLHRIQKWVVRYNQYTRQDKAYFVQKYEVIYSSRKNIRKKALARTNDMRDLARYDPASKTPYAWKT